MKKADELWEKYARNGLTEIGKVDFLAALQEYGEAVRAEMVAEGWRSPEQVNEAVRNSWGTNGGCMQPKVRK